MNDRKHNPKYWVIHIIGTEVNADAHVRIHVSFGTWKLGNGQAVVDQVEQAISVGFSHIGITLKSSLFVSPLNSGLGLDTAQLYENEAEGGIAIRESGLARDEIFITTKFVGLGGRDIPTSIRDSLKYVSFLSICAA